MYRRTTYFSKKVTFLNVLSTFLVVFLHAKPQERFGLPLDMSQPFIYLTWVFSQAAVPLFFFVSAILFYKNCSLSLVPKKLKSRFWSLVVPYLLWNVLFVTIFWVLTHVDFLHSKMNVGAVLNSPREIVFAIISARYTVLWFVKDLIILSLLSPLFLIILKNRIVSGVSLVITIILPIVLSKYMTIGYEHTMNWLPIYFMGAIVGSTLSYEASSNKLNLESHPWNSVLAKRVVGVCSIVLLTFTYKYAVKGEGYFYPYRLVSPICIWFLVDVLLHGFIQDRFVVREWMSYCFMIYCIHQFLLNVIEKIFVLTVSPTSLVLNLMFIVCPIMVILIVIGFCQLTHDTKFYKLFTGGR